MTISNNPLDLTYEQLKLAKLVASQRCFVCNSLMCVPGESYDIDPRFYRDCSNEVYLSLECRKNPFSDHSIYLTRLFEGNCPLTELTINLNAEGGWYQTYAGFCWQISDKSVTLHAPSTKRINIPWIEPDISAGSKLLDKLKTIAMLM